MKEPAWKKVCYQNMRGKRVGGWYIITHIRNGYWKASRVMYGKMRFATVRLDYFGQIINVTSSRDESLGDGLILRQPL